jgi:hypothetical protein
VEVAEAYFKALSMNCPEEMEEAHRIMHEDRRFPVGTGLKDDNTVLNLSTRKYFVVSESQIVNLALRVTSAAGQNLEYIKRNACYD